MKYVVVGKIAEPTLDQQERARLTGGWSQRSINSQDVLWNACVSPPFGGGDNYQL